MSKKEKELATEDYEYVTVPPDGGFGWVIAFAAMVLSWIIRFLSNYFN